MSTEDVVELVIKVATKEAGCRFVELTSMTLASDQRTVALNPDEGPPDYFLSHAWTGNFCALVDSVLERLADAPNDTRVWLDIFAVNQHHPAEDLGDFEAAIERSASTLLFIDAEGTPFSRTWCLHELERTLAHGGSEGLIIVSDGLSAEQIVNMFMEIDASKAQARNPDDKKRIDADIIAHHGSLQEFTEFLKLHLLLNPLSIEKTTAMLASSCQDAGAFDVGHIQDLMTPDGDMQKAACILSGAGTGKSTIIASVLAAAKHGDDVAAGFFVSHRNTRSMDAFSMIKTLAFQLAMRNADLRAHLCALEAADLMHMECASSLEAIDEAARILLKVPLAKIETLRSCPILIAIDGVDEADPEDTTMHARGESTQSIAPKGNGVLTCITDVLSKLPQTVSILVAMRPDTLRGQGRSALEAAFPSLQLVAPKDVLSDALVGPDGTPAMLLYHTVSRLLPRPVRCDVPTLADVECVYALLFGMHVPHERQDQLLACIVASAEPLPLSLVAAMGLLEVFESLPGHGELFRDVDHRVHVLHKSLSDWLTTQSKSTAHFVDARIGHDLLSTFLGRDRQDVQHARYADRNMLTHLAKAGTEQALELLDAVLCDFGFIARLARTPGYIQHALLALASVAGSPSAVVVDTTRWLRSSGERLGSSVDSVVQGALDHCPVGSLVFQRALREISQAWTLQRVVARDGCDNWGVREAALHQRTETASALAWSPCSSRLAVAGDDNVVIWRMATMQREAVFQADGAKPTSIAWSGDGERLAAGGTDSSLRIWRVGSGELEATLPGHVGAVILVAWSRDGTSLASAGTGRDNAPLLWRKHDGIGWEDASVLRGHDDEVLSLEFHPRGTIVASAGMDGMVCLWDVATGDRMMSVDHGCPITSIAWRFDGKQLASAGWNGMVHIWDSATQERVATLGRDDEHIGRLDCVVWSQTDEGGMLACAGASGVVHMWCMRTKTRHATLTAHNGEVRSLAWSPDGRRIATAGSDERVRLWLVESVAADADRIGHKGPVNCVAGSPKGDWVVTGGDDGRMWIAGSGGRDGSLACMPDAHGGAITAVSVSPSGERIATGGSDGTVCLWSAETHARQAGMRGHNGCVTEIAWGPRDQLVSCGKDGTVRIWDADTAAEITVFRGHFDAVLAVAWSPTKGGEIASAGEDRAIHLWSPATAQTRATLSGHDDDVTCLACSPDGQEIVSGGRDGSLVVWDVSSATQRAKLSGSHGVTCVAWGGPPAYPELWRIASGGADSRIRVWDAASCSPQLTLPAHASGIRGVAWLGDARLATVGGDGALCVWFDSTVAEKIGAAEKAAAEKAAAERAAAERAAAERAAAQKAAAEKIAAEKAKMAAYIQANPKCLIKAAEAGDAAKVAELIAAGANLEAKDSDGCTPLARAALNGEKECVDTLIAARANLEAQDKDGRTPISLAAARGKKEFVDTLIAARANMEAQDKNGRTALRWATEEGHAECAALLRAAGAKE